MANFIAAQAKALANARKHQVMMYLAFREGGFTVGRIARDCQMHKSYSHGLLKKMVENGLVMRYDGVDKRGQKIVLYCTAYSYVIAANAAIPTLSLKECEAMLECASQGVTAAEWYGYEPTSAIVSPSQEEFCPF